LGFGRGLCKACLYLWCMLNEETIPKQNRLPFFTRFFIYQKERFPFLGHGILVASFGFSAIAYSRICRGQVGFVSIPVFLAAIFTTISLFLLVRIFDEFKDAHDDALYRKNLPVPRGLVSLRELFIVGAITVILQLVVNLAFFPKILWLYGIVIFYLCLMGKEFFIARWLKQHQFWYVVSHMMIIPLIDILASGYDWFLQGVAAPKGLYGFFAVSFMNGVVLEIGRKIKTPGQEAPGVLTYSGLMGTRRAAYFWIFILFITLCLSTGAAWYTGHGIWTYITLFTAFVFCTLPAVFFIRHQTAKRSRLIEYVSALWTIVMYLSLGGIPKLTELLS